MSGLQDWAATLCTLAIGCSLLSMLCPAGRMRRVCGILTAVLFLCCLLSPLGSMLTFVKELFVLPENTQVSVELTDEVNEQARRILTEALLSDARERLSETATVKKVAVYRDSSRTDSIYIERVRVTLDKQDRGAGAVVRAALEQAWGVAVEVYYVG